MQVSNMKKLSVALIFGVIGGVLGIVAGLILLIK